MARIVTAKPPLRRKTFSEPRREPPPIVDNVVSLQRRDNIEMAKVMAHTGCNLLDRGELMVAKRMFELAADAIGKA